jgi:hypothetical protein
MRRDPVLPRQPALFSAISGSPAIQFHPARAAGGSVVFFLASQALMAAAMLAAQGTNAPAPSSAVAPQSSGETGHRKKSSANHANLAASQPAPAPAPAPPPPPLPNWPANDRPSDATVTWDSHGLRVVAANSSLTQILRDISTQTGASVEGLGKDERVFGIYGPGPARDVISQLLDGSGYNVLLIGDSGLGTPRQILLTTQPGAGQQAAQVNSPAAAPEDEPEPEPEAQQQPAPSPQQESATPNGAAQGVPVRSQQEMIQEMQQRQQQLLQQQQQNPH